VILHPTAVRHILKAAVDQRAQRCHSCPRAA
jgi:hypothetical protein